MNSFVWLGLTVLLIVDVVPTGLGPGSFAVLARLARLLTLGGGVSRRTCVFPRWNR